MTPEQRRILRGVTAVHEGDYATHCDGCYRYHAGCLAVLLTNMEVVPDD